MTEDQTACTQGKLSLWDIYLSLLSVGFEQREAVFAAATEVSRISMALAAFLGAFSSLGVLTG